MNATDLLRVALTMTRGATENIVADLRKHPLVRATPGGNHTLWLIGHLAFVEGAVHSAINGVEHPLKKWESLFAMGSTPSDDASRYPSIEEALAKYFEARDANIRLLGTLSDADLDQKPKFIPPGFEEAMATVGRALQLLALHNMVHYGQLADARRSAGYTPLI